MLCWWLKMDYAVGHDWSLIPRPNFVVALLLIFLTFPFLYVGLRATCTIRYTIFSVVHHRNICQTPLIHYIASSKVSYNVSLSISLSISFLMSASNECRFIQFLQFDNQFDKFFNRINIFFPFFVWFYFFFGLLQKNVQCEDVDVIKGNDDMSEHENAVDQVALESEQDSQTTQKKLYQHNMAQTPPGQGPARSGCLFFNCSLKPLND